MEEVAAFLRTNPWASAYGPVLLVLVLTLGYKVAIRLISTKKPQLRWVDFHLGLSLLWASFGRAFGKLVSDVSDPNRANVPYDDLLAFFFAWAFLGIVVFVCHGAYDMPVAELKAELTKQNNGTEPTGRAVFWYQFWGLFVVSNLLALATFAVYDYLFVQAIFARGDP